MGDFIGGIILGVLVASPWVYDYATSEYDSKLSDCQKDLPRSQNCVLIAVPKLVLDASEESKEK